jgi:hypothetical protein
LRWVLESYLRNDSLVDVGSRKVAYQELFVFLTIVGQSYVFANLLTCSLAAGETKDEAASVTCLSLLKTLRAQAEVYLKLNQNVLNMGPVDPMDTDALNLDEFTAYNQDDGEEVMEALAMALHITQTFDDVANCIAVAESMGLCSASKASSPEKDKADKGKTPASSSSTPEASPAKAASVDTALMAKEYVSILGEQRFEAIEMVSTIESAAQQQLVNCSHIFLNPHYQYDSHYHGRQSGSTTAMPPKQRLSRIAKEMSSLLTNLPVELGSSIFVRCDEVRQDIMKALIIGPEGTVSL